MVPTMKYSYDDNISDIGAYVNCSNATASGNFQ